MEDKLEGSTVADVCSRLGVSERTWFKWNPFERTGQHRSGRPTALSAEQVSKMLNGPSWMREQKYEWQIAHYGYRVSRRTTIKLLREHKKRWGHKKAGKFKEPIMRKLSENFFRPRQEYDLTYGPQPAFFWQRVHFSDEGHIDPSDFGSSYILGEEGTRTNPKNTKEGVPKAGSLIHFGSWISYEDRGELVFYETKPPPPPPNPNDPEPLKRSWKKHREWEARQPQSEAKNMNNSMTQLNYLEWFLKPYHVPDLLGKKKKGNRPI